MERGKRESVEPAIRVSRFRARAMGYGGAFAVIAASLVLLSPIASAAPIHSSSVTLKAPYSGSTEAIGVFISEGCGNTVTIPITPNFNLTTGVLTQGASVATKSCGSSPSVVDFDVGEELTSSHTFSTTTGKQTVTVTWALKYVVALATKTGGAGQTALAGAEVLTAAFLYDTNGTTTEIAESLAEYLNSSSPTTHSYSVTVTDTNTSVPFVAGHTYEIETEVVVVAGAEVSTGKCTASASVNMGTSGEKGTLKSIVIP